MTGQRGRTNIRMRVFYEGWNLWHETGGKDMHYAALGAKHSYLPFKNASYLSTVSDCKSAMCNPRRGKTFKIDFVKTTSYGGRRATISSKVNNKISQQQPYLLKGFKYRPGVQLRLNCVGTGGRNETNLWRPSGDNIFQGE